MFGIFTSAETHVVRAQENADLKKRIKVLEEAAENREKAFAKREKATEERHEDAMHDVKRDNKRVIEALEDEHEDEIRELNSDHRDEVDELNRTIAALESDAEETKTNVKLAIKEAELAMKGESMEEVNAIYKKLVEALADNKVVEAEGKAKAAAGVAESSAKDEVIEILTNVSDVFNQRNGEMLETISEVSPKVDLSKFEVNVTVPQGGNKGGEQKQEKKQN